MVFNEYVFEHFTCRELFQQNSDTEIALLCTTGCLDSLLVLLRFLDGLRDYLETPIKINSAFRDSVHNKSVGGSSTSQHLLGQAIDFCTPKMPNNCTIIKFKEFCKVSPLAISIGQVIFYENFIHIGLRTQSHKTLCYYDKRNIKNNY